jgi:hypothetical protein
MGFGKNHPLLRQLVQVRGLNVVCPVTIQFGPEIVNGNKQNVGHSGTLLFGLA